MNREVPFRKRALMRRLYRVRAPAPPARMRPLLDALEREGAVVTSLEALGLAGSTAMVEAARALLSDGAVLRRSDGAKAFMETVEPSAIDARPAVPLWGLDEALLSLVGAYLGAAPAYRGVALRRDLPDGRAGATRAWHRDFEDHRILKAIVYLSDVDGQSGPFTYIPAGRSPDRSRLVFEQGRATDDSMRATGAADAAVACTGPAGTVVLADTCTLWHRGAIIPSEGRERLTAFFAYNTKHPRAPEHCRPMIDRARLLSSDDLTDRQVGALTYSYG